MSESGSTRDARAPRGIRIGVGLVTAVAAVGVCALLATGSATPESRTVTGSGPAALAAGSDTRPVTLAFGGGVRVEGAVAAALSEDPSRVLAGVAPVLAEADIAVVNLETGVSQAGTAAPGSGESSTSGQPSTSGGSRAPTTVFAALRAAGADVASLASEPGMDLGSAGLRDSLQAASDNLFPVIGIGRDEEQAYAPYLRTVHGQRIAVLAATQVPAGDQATDWAASDSRPGLASAARVGRLVAAVRSARSGADTVVVFLHWGRERSHCPTDTQRALARQLAAAGADVVVGGHHAHLQGGGYLGGTYVDFGLGSLAPSRAWSSGSADSGILTLTVDRGRVLEADWHPARIEAGLPVLLEGQAAEPARQRKAAYRACTPLTEQPTGSDLDAGVGPGLDPSPEEGGPTTEDGPPHGPASGEAVPQASGNGSVDRLSRPAQ